MTDEAIVALNPDDGSVLYQIGDGVFTALCGDEGAGSFSNWLTTNLTSGTIPAGASAEIEVLFNATNLNAGFYESTLSISSNDLTNPLIELPVSMGVIGEPSISSDVDSLDFGSVVVGDSIAKTLIVNNIGSDNLDVSNVMTNNLDFEIDTLSFSLLPDQSISLNISYHPQTVEVDDTELWILSNDIDTDTLKIPLKAKALAPSEIDLNVTTITTTLYSDETSSVMLQIFNNGGSDLTGQTFLEFSSGNTVQVSAMGRNIAHYQLDEVQKTQMLQNIRDTKNLLPRTSITSQNFIFSDDIENGDNGWYTAVYSGQDIWHQTALTSNGENYSWWCGVEDLLSYNTGSRVNTAVISPVISLPNTSSNLSLIFDEVYETEAGWDVCMVDVSLDGGVTWSPLRGTVSGSSDGWKTTILDISSYTGNDIQVRFYFDTGDGISQDFSGWFFDNVSIIKGDGSIPEWASLSLEEFNVSAGDSLEMDFHFMPQGLSPGVYQANMFVLSNDPLTPSLEVPIELTVLASGGIETNISEIAYSSIPVGLSESHTFSIQNIGNDTLFISNMYTSQSDFEIEESSFFILPDENRSINVVFSPSDVVMRSAQLVIVSNDVSDPEISIDLAGTGLAPIFNVPPTVVDQTFSVPENSTAGYFVGQVISKDLNFNSMTYSIESGNEGGAYTMSNGGVLVIKKASELDFENRAVHELDVTVSDGELSTYITITINVEDINEAPAVAAQTFSVIENSATGYEIGTVLGSDVDGDDLTYSLVSGNESAVFALSSAGVLTLKDASLLDFEGVSSYTLSVSVSDGTLSTSATITINVEDINEAPAVAAQTFSVIENSATGFEIGSIVGSDVDGDDLTYSLVSGNESDLFILTSTGLLTMKGESLLDFESGSMYSLGVSVTDGTLSSSATITINVEDVNEAPMLAAQSFSVLENSSAGLEIGTIEGSDVDGDPLSYKIVSGNTDEAFILSGEGVLTLAENANLNFEEKTVYELIVEITDGQLSATNTLIVNIEDVFELSASKSLDKITLHPNPAFSYIKIENAKLTGEVQVVDLSGKQIPVEMTVTEEVLELDIAHLIPGVYYVMIGDGETRIIKVFVKQ